MLELLFCALFALVIYKWTFYIGPKAVEFGKKDPDRKSNKWIVGELANMLLLFGFMLGPILLLDLRFEYYILLSILPILLQFFIFKKYYYQDLKASMREEKNA